MKTTLLLAIIFLGLNGCGDSNKTEKKEETFKTVNYYDTHTKERDARTKECATMKNMTKTIMIDCENAHNSYLKTQSSRFDAGDIL